MSSVVFLRSVLKRKKVGILKYCLRKNLLAAFIKLSKITGKKAAPKQGFQHKASPYCTCVLVLALKKTDELSFLPETFCFCPKVQVLAFTARSLSHNNSTKYFSSAILHCQSFPISAHTTPLLHAAHLAFESSYKSPINLSIVNSTV